MQKVGSIRLLCLATNLYTGANIRIIFETAKDLGINLIRRYKLFRNLTQF